MPGQPSQHAALRGEPSYIWRAGQQRRLELIQREAGDRLQGIILEDGCGVGQYLTRLSPSAKLAVGLEIEHDRAIEAHALGAQMVCAAGEGLPFQSDLFDFVLSHEVLEHVHDDRTAVEEIVRTLKPGGRLALFVPNRGYPFETHGIYRMGVYHFGNKIFVNWLPRKWRDRLAPHVRIYSNRDLERLFHGLPLKVVQRTILFGAYDNIIARHPALGRILRSFLQALERTPLKLLGLSHFWVLEKTGSIPTG